MHPLIFLPIGLGLYKILESLFPEDTPYFKIYKDNPVICYKNSNMSVIKNKITRHINIIIKEYDSFKIGETGIPDTRSSQHKEQFNNIFLLCKSKNKFLIDDLEAYYNSKYIDHPKNLNKKKGSAGRMSDKEGYYWLYIVTI